jgi:phage terminase large subunit
MLLDYSGWAVIGSTPQGFNYFYDLFRYGQNPEMPEWQAWQYTIADNPYILRSEIEQVKALLPDIVFQREYLAEFRVNEGLVFDNFSLSENVTEAAEYTEGQEVYWGVDDGYAHGAGIGTPGHHPRVIVMAQPTATGGLNVFDEYYRTLQLPEATLSEVFAWRYPRPRLALVDSSAAELRRRLSEYGIHNGAASHRVSDGIKIVRRFICDGQGVRSLKIHPRCVNLIRELQSYRYDDRSKVAEAGEPKPMKMDDHACDALRYLIWNFK